MKLKALSSAPSVSEARKDRHLELFFLMIGMSLAFAFAHVSIVSDLNSQNLPVVNYPVGCQKTNAVDLTLAPNVTNTLSNSYDKDIQHVWLSYQNESPLAQWIVHNFGTIYTSVAALVIVLGCTCSAAPSNRRSS